MDSQMSAKLLVAATSGVAFAALLGVFIPEVEPVTRALTQGVVLIVVSLVAYRVIDRHWGRD